MSYDNTIDFKDHIVQYPNRFKQTTVAAGVVELVPTWIENSNEIIEPGTPVDSELFKKLKQNVTIYQQTFTTTNNQTVINLNRHFLVGQNRVSLTIGGVKQYSGQDYAETDTNKLTMMTPQKGGLKAEVLIFTASQAIAEDFFDQVTASLTATQAANTAAQSANNATVLALSGSLNWRSPVDTFSQLASVTNRKERDTIMIRDTGKVYRYNGSSWIEIQELAPGPINGLETRLSLNLGAKPLDYGVFSLPIPEFISLPFTMARNANGVIFHDYMFTRFKSGSVVFVSATGDNATGNGSISSPYRDIYYALENTIGDIIIKSLSPRLHRGVRNRTIDGRRVTIMPADGIERLYLTQTVDTEVSAMIWSAEDNVFKTTLSGIYSMFDLAVKDIYGVPKALTNVATIAECKATPGTWYTDNVVVYVNTWTGAQPVNANYVLNGRQTHFEPTLQNNATLYLENVTILHGRTSVSNVITEVPNGIPNCKFVCRNTHFAGGDLRISRNSEVNCISINNIGQTLFFDCIAAYGGEDGFNYHYSGVLSAHRRKCLAVEFGCVSYDHGKYSTTNTSNCSTCHNTANILRVNGIYQDSRGPIVNDADACLAITMDSHARKSTATQTVQRSAFRCDQDGVSIATAKMALINCTGGDETTTAVYTGDGIQIFVQAFRGTNFNPAIALTLL